MRRLERPRDLPKPFGRRPHSVLVRALRSGAAVSMPGMMDHACWISGSATRRKGRSVEGTAPFARETRAPVHRMVSKGASWAARLPGPKRVPYSCAPRLRPCSRRGTPPRAVAYRTHHGLGRMRGYRGGGAGNGFLRPNINATFGCRVVFFAKQEGTDDRGGVEEKG